MRSKRFGRLFRTFGVFLLFGRLKIGPSSSFRFFPLAPIFTLLKSKRCFEGEKNLRKRLLRSLARLKRPFKRFRCVVYAREKNGMVEKSFREKSYVTSEINLFTWLCCAHFHFPGTQMKINGAMNEEKPLSFFAIGSSLF